jgi:hypothetical protein
MWPHGKEGLIQRKEQIYVTNERYKNVVCNEHGGGVSRRIVNIVI